MTPAPAAVGKSTKTAAGAANSAGSRLKIKGNPKNKEGYQRAKLSVNLKKLMIKEVRKVIQLDEYRQQLAATLETLKKAGESL